MLTHLYHVFPVLDQGQKDQDIFFSFFFFFDAGPSGTVLIIYLFIYIFGSVV